MELEYCVFGSNFLDLKKNYYWIISILILKNFNIKILNFFSEWDFGKWSRYAILRPNNDKIEVLEKMFNGTCKKNIVKSLTLPIGKILSKKQ